MDGVVNVLLVVEPDPDQDADDVRDRLARRLRTELTELDVESVTLATGDPAPEGSKSADPVTVGAVVVALSASGGVFTTLIETVRAWLARQPAHHRISVTIDGDTIELEQASAGQQQALVDAYIGRHTNKQPK